MVRGRSTERYVEGLSLGVDANGVLDWEESFIDASFFPQKGSSGRENQEGKGTKCMVVVDGKGLPLGSHTDSASPAEVRLAEKTLQQIKSPNKGPGRPRTRPKRVIGDKAYRQRPSPQALEKTGYQSAFSSSS